MANDPNFPEDYQDEDTYREDNITAKVWNFPGEESPSLSSNFAQPAKKSAYLLMFIYLYIAELQIRSTSRVWSCEMDKPSSKW